MEADISSQAVGLASSADFSLMNLFLRADIIAIAFILAAFYFLLSFLYRRLVLLESLLQIDNFD